MNESRFKYVLKFIIIGNPNVGKSCILNQFLNHKFVEEYEVTVGVEFGAKTIKLKDSTNVKLQIWDTAGQESFKSVTRSYYRSSAVAIIVYDITNRESYEAIEKWIEDCRVNGNKEMSMMLVGNKLDLDSHRIVSYEEGEILANENNMLFLETSAKSSENIDMIFAKTAEIIYKKILNKEIDPTNDVFGVKTGTSYKKSAKLDNIRIKNNSGCCT